VPPLFISLVDTPDSSLGHDAAFRMAVQNSISEYAENAGLNPLWLSRQQIFDQPNPVAGAEGEDVVVKIVVRVVQHAAALALAVTDP